MHKNEKKKIFSRDTYESSDRNVASYNFGNTLLVGHKHYPHSENFKKGPTTQSLLEILLHVPLSRMYIGKC